MGEGGEGIKVPPTSPAESLPGMSEENKSAGADHDIAHRQAMEQQQRLQEEQLRQMFAQMAPGAQAAPPRKEQDKSRNRVVQEPIAKEKNTSRPKIKIPNPFIWFKEKIGRIWNWTNKNISEFVQNINNLLSKTKTPQVT